MFLSCSEKFINGVGNFVSYDIIDSAEITALYKSQNIPQNLHMIVFH
jgi:hypothetical protein